MNASNTNRVPFSKPLTGHEMRHIQQRISEVVRERTKPAEEGRPILGTHEELVAEVESAIAHFNSKAERQARYDRAYAAKRRERYQAAKRGSFPPFCRVPKAVLSAVISA